MNPLDWSLIAGPLPVFLLVGALLALAWLAAGRNAPGHRWLRRGARGGTAGGAPSVRWLVLWVPLIYPQRLDFVSARVRDFQGSASYGEDQERYFYKYAIS